MSKYVEKLLSHFVHFDGSSPLWVLSSFFKWPGIEKILSYKKHLKGFSPVRILSCSSWKNFLKNTCHFLCTWMASLLSGSSQVTWCWGTLVTLCALKWLPSCVGPLIFLQVARYWEDLVTHWAFERHLSHVGPLMLPQRTWSWKELVTLCALEWLLYYVVSK